jgi:lysophospholipase L1-like esterase
MLGAPKTGEDRVVFMGDSITQGWKLDAAFPGKPYVNRGISGQTTPQMLVRFRQDVIDLKPKVVVILAGTNDIAGNTGPMTLEQTEGNLASMAELAAANGIRVVLCSVLPAFDYHWAPGLTPAPKIAQVNAWLKRVRGAKRLRVCRLLLRDEGRPRRTARDAEQGRGAPASGGVRGDDAAGGSGY